MDESQDDEVVYSYLVNEINAGVVTESGDGFMTVHPTGRLALYIPDQTTTYDGDQSSTIADVETGFYDKKVTLTFVTNDTDDGNAGTYSYNISAASAGLYSISVTPEEGSTIEPAIYEAGDWTISPKEIVIGDITLLYQELEYNASVQQQGVVIRIDDTELEEGTDYDVSGDTEGTDADDYILKVKGKGNYSGEVDVEWSIHPFEISEYREGVAYTVTNPTYTGSEQTVTVVLTIDGFTITEDDYDLEGTTSATYKTETDQYPVSIVGTGNFGGVIATYWNIEPRDIGDAEVLLADSPIYNFGEEVTQGVVSITVDNLTFFLSDHDDLEVSDDVGSDIRADGYVLYVDGNNNFIGSCSASWNVQPMPLDGDGVTVDVSFADMPVYDGIQKTPTITSVSIDEYDLDASNDYHVECTAQTDVNTNGSYSLTIYGDGNFTGSISREWNIQQASLESVILTLAAESGTYTGSVQNGPTYTIKIGDVDVSGDFNDPSWSSDAIKDVGIYTLTISSKNTNIVPGVKTGDFEVTAASTSDVTFNVAYPELTYTGSDQENSVTASLNGVDVTADFTVTMPEDMKNAGDKSISIAPANSNFIGSTTASFTIQSASASSEEVVVTLTSKSGVFNEQPHEVGFTVTFNDVDVTADFNGEWPEDMTSTGDKTLTLTPKNDNFTGEASATYTIMPEPVSTENITVDFGEDVSSVYDGEPKTARVTGGLDFDDSYYTISFVKNGTDPAVTEFLTAGTYDVIIALNDGAGVDFIFDGPGVSEDHRSITLSSALTIEKADYDMSGVSFHNATKKYNRLPQHLEISGTLPTGADGIQVTVSYSGSAITARDGPRTITAVFATESENYNVPAPMTAVLTISEPANPPAPIDYDSGSGTTTEKKNDKDDDIDPIVVACIAAVAAAAAIAVAIVFFRQQ
ncbi:MAG: hypothetical protein E7Z64_06415 [Thermoplasmata archaeon]|nr:hypothetical protein [Thermoplasmata archaeon]